MADALKTFFSASLVQRMGESIVRVYPRFDLRAFVRDASRGLGDLELLARGRHIALALRTHLPKRYEDAIEVLLAALGPEHDGDELEGVGMAPFFYLPHVTFVAMFGLDDFAVSMRAQHELTRRFTAEFSIRPFLERYPDETLRVLGQWVDDESAHVRRLVSEGTRPRLPWAARVRWIEEAPERVLPLLERLKDDPSSFVRRSVANHLNDVSKANPELVCAIARRWLRGASPERRALVEHALRTCVKRSNPTALALLGFGERPRVAITDVAFRPKTVAVGERTRIEFALRSKSRTRQSLVVDLVVHFVKARGHTSPKVFKIARLDLDAGASATLGKNVSLAVHTTRKPNAGRHLVEAQVNGERFELGSFAVMSATRKRPGRP